MLRYTGNLNKTKLYLRKSQSLKSISSNLIRTSPFLSSKVSVRSIKLRHRFNSFEKVDKILRFISLGFFTFSRVRQSLTVLQYASLLSKKNKIKNKSVLTLKSRAFSKEFPISRISFRKLAAFGYISGISKSSW